MSKPKFVKFNGVNINADHYKGKNLTEFKTAFKKDHKENAEVNFTDEDLKELHDVINAKDEKAEAPKA